MSCGVLLPVLPDRLEVWAAVLLRVQDRHQHNGRRSGRLAFVVRALLARLK